MNKWRLLTIASLAAVLGAQAPPTRKLVAQIGDQAVYEDDLQPMIGGQLLQLNIPAGDSKNDIMWLSDVTTVPN